MLSKNLVLRKICYYYGDTKIKTDSKIYLSKTKMELMKKNFFKVLDYVKSIFEEDIAAIDLEAKERIGFGEQALIFRNSKNEDYLMKNSDKEKAIDDLIAYQTVLCGTNGFVAGLGGLLVLPVAIPANIASVIYVQLRMIAAITYINGYDIHSDQVRILAYTCLTGSSATNILKNVGIKIGEKAAVNALKKIPGAILVKINQQVGFRLVTKFG